MPVNIIYKSDEFHSNYRQNPSDCVCRLNEMLDLMYYYQKFERKVELSHRFLCSLFQFHGYETNKKVTNSDSQKHKGRENILKISLRF